MIDFHSHILPQVDDGSQSVEESLLMLNKLNEQGIHTVVATPHFYANSATVDGFLAKRQEAYELLKKETPANHPRLLLGAEVRYYEGISRLEGLKRLCIGNSGLLLLEMPMAKWTDYTVNELIDMSRSSEYRLVLAHIERYYDLQSAGVWRCLSENDVLFQVNASFFLSLRTRRKAISLLKKGFVHFIGSDCHDLQNRPPVIGPAYELLAKKLEDGLVSQMLNFGFSFVK